MDNGRRQIHLSYDAFHRLQDSFDRWQLERLRCNKIPTAPPLLLMIDLDRYRKMNHLPPVPKLIRDINQLPIVPRDGSLENQCHICLEPFEDRETPVRLPCNHIFGSVCLQNWLWPFGEGVNCPMCRANTFLNHKDLTSPLHSEHGMNLEYRLDEVVWADFHGGAELSPKEHALTRSERYKIVKYRISKALIESSDNIPTSAETFEDEQKWQEMRTRIDWISQVLTDAKHEYDQDYQYRGPMEYYNPELGYMVGADGDYMVGEYGENAEWTGLDDLSESEDSAWESDNSASELNDPAFEEHVDHPPSSPESEYFIDPSAIQWLGDTEMADPTTPTETSGPEVNEIPVPMEVDNGFSEAEDEAWIYTTDGRR